MKNIQDAPIEEGTRVLVRMDLDVPIVNGEIKETFRLDVASETLKHLISKKADITLMGHMGRPDGKPDQTLSTIQLKPYFDNFFDGYPYKLLENLRFDAREEDNNSEFARELAAMADIYINESFANCHREHASMVGVPSIIPGFAGVNLTKEVTTLGGLLEQPERPFIALIGGAKIETKKPIIDKMLSIADAVLVGGKIGLDWKENTPKNLFLPLDYARDEKDIGEKTIKLFSDMIKTAQTIIWAGPMGMFEDPEFIAGTKDIVSSIQSSKAFSVVGGGDTVAAIELFGDKEKMGFVSSGGGAMLEFLVKGSLPALEVLR